MPLRVCVCVPLCVRRAKKGLGSWNWRFKFPVTVPTKVPRIHIQMWDRDVVKWSDCISETVIGLRDLFKLARFKKVRLVCLRLGDP